MEICNVNWIDGRFGPLCICILYTELTVFRLFTPVVIWEPTFSMGNRFDSKLCSHWALRLKCHPSNAVDRKMIRNQSMRRMLSVCTSPVYTQWALDCTASMIPYWWHLAIIHSFWCGNTRWALHSATNSEWLPLSSSINSQMRLWWTSCDGFLVSPSATMWKIDCSTLNLNTNTGMLPPTIMAKWGRNCSFTSSYGTSTKIAMTDLMTWWRHIQHCCYLTVRSFLDGADSPHCLFAVMQHYKTRNHVDRKEWN